jgi:hypothetical protein
MRIEERLRRSCPDLTTRYLPRLGLAVTGKGRFSLMVMGVLCRSMDLGLWRAAPRLGRCTFSGELLENSGGPVATRTPDLYRVKVGNALLCHQMRMQVIDSIENRLRQKPVSRH